MKTFEVVLERPNRKEEVIHHNLTEKQAIEYTDYIDNTYYREELTLSEKIAKIDPEKVIILKNKYGVFWTGKAKYVFSSVTNKAWKSTDTDVIL